MRAEEVEALVAVARAARLRAYAPYSRFLVGAAVVTGGGTFVGCNVENAAFGPTICAERVAATTAIAAGHRDLLAVAVVAGRRRSRTGPVSPCGVCRQFLYEFNPDMVVVSEGTDGTRARWRLSALLLDGFGPNDVAPPAGPSPRRS